MIKDNLEFHNVVALEPRKGFSGLQLQRYPELVRNEMSPRGRWNSQMTPGCEIRLVTDADHIRLFVSSLEGDAPLLVYCGDILHSRHYLNPGEIKCIHVSPEPQFDLVTDKAFAGQRFSIKVWRFFFTAYQTMFHDLETYNHEYRPPTKREKPKLRWLAYGSSITAGAGTTSPELCYPQLAAKRLGVDILNMAQGGACMCEKGNADFFAERDDWDFATYEIGVNMLGFFTPAKFQKRAEYLIRTTIDKNPGKPVIVITSFLNYSDFAKKENQLSRRLKAYNKILRDLVSSAKCKHLHLIEGGTILTEFTGLNGDLIHPSNYGNILMAENLSKQLKKILKI